MWASTKGDHAMGELLALYDTPYDVSNRHTPMPRYVNLESYNSNASNVSKERFIVDSQDDVKVRPFVNSSLANRASSSVEERKTSSTTQHHGVSLNGQPFVKKERISPASTYPGTECTRRVSTTESQAEIEPQPINYTMKKLSSTSKPVEPASTAQRNPKREAVNDKPLDLSVKKLRMTAPTQRFISRADCHPVDQQAQRRSNYAIVHPTYHHSQLRIPTPNYFYKVIPHQFAVSNHITLPAVPPTNMLYQALAARNSHVIEPVKPLTKLSGDAQQPTRTPVEAHGLNLPGSLRKITPQDSPSGGPSGCRRKISAEQPLKNKHFIECNNTSLRVSARGNIASTAAKLSEVGIAPQVGIGPVEMVLDPIQLQMMKKYPDLRYITPEIRRFIEACDQHRPIRECSAPVADYHASLETRRSSTNSSVVSAVATEKKHSMSREQRYHNDESQNETPTYHKTSKQALVRRTSLPIDGGMSNEKLDLRSYTGCLPPHYLHLLESSGNLPIKTTNALKNVADILQDDMVENGITIKQETPDKEIKISNIRSQTRSPEPTVHSSSNPATNASLISISPCATPPLLFSIANKLPVCSVSKIFDFDELGDWSSIEKGEYPAFDLPYKLSSSQQDKTSHKPSFSTDFRVNQKYISEGTKAILRSVTVPLKQKHSSPRLGYRLSSTNKQAHKCACCANSKKSEIPTLIENIWKFTPSRKYVIASSVTSSNAVYCSEMEVRKAHLGAETSSADLPKEKEVPPLAISREEAGPVPLLRRTHRMNSLDAKLEQLRKRAIDRQVDSSKTTSTNDSVAEKVSPSSSPQQTVVDVMNRFDDTCDVLANSIEDSSDDECDKKAAAVTNGPRRNIVRKLQRRDSPIDGRSCYPKVLEVNQLRNVERNSDISRHMTLSQYQVMSSSCHNRMNSAEDIGISDLEISDDEDTNTMVNEREAGKIA
ncbi:uncharacterized protein LOC143446356 isoform X2 [Clavelina lepadiformis]